MAPCPLHYKKWVLSLINLRCMGAVSLVYCNWALFRVGPKKWAPKDGPGLVGGPANFVLNRRV